MAFWLFKATEKYFSIEKKHRMYNKKNAHDAQFLVLILICYQIFYFICFRIPISQYIDINVNYNCPC